MKKIVLGALLALAPLGAETIVIQNATVMTGRPQGDLMPSPFLSLPIQPR